MVNPPSSNEVDLFSVAVEKSICCRHQSTLALQIYRLN
jgi:hypothetical protein